MEKIKLNNGVEMPVFGFGTYKVKDPAECERSVTTAIGAGYRLIDTAQFYDNEAAVGAAIKNCGVAREELFVTTKVWFRSFETEDCRASLDGSLRKLGMDYLDLVLLHWPFGNVYAAWRVLEEYYAAGKIRAIGVSNMDPDRLIDLITFNKVCPAVNQIETHLYIEDVSVFESYLVLELRKNGLIEIEIKSLKNGEVKNISFPEPVYTAYLGANPEYSSDKVPRRKELVPMTLPL